MPFDSGAVGDQVLVINFGVLAGGDSSAAITVETASIAQADNRSRGS